MNIQERIERHLMSERQVEKEAKKMAENYLKGGIHPSDENTVEKITEKIQVKITKTKGVQGEEE